MDRKLLRGVSVFIALFFLNIKIHKTSVSLGTIVASATLFLFPHKVLSIHYVSSAADLFRILTFLFKKIIL